MLFMDRSFLPLLARRQWCGDVSDPLKKFRYFSVLCGEGTLLAGASMAAWTLECRNCGFYFEHSKIRRRNLVDFYYDAKPEFPPEGSEFECPNCGNRATYQRTDLRYRA
jgi:rubredoxin